MILCALFLCLGASVQAQTAHDGTPCDVPLADGAYAAVTTAIAASASGVRTVICLPAGSWTWPDKVTIPSEKSIWLMGAGPTRTIITNGRSAAECRLIDVNTAVGAPTYARVSGFQINAQGTACLGFGEQLQVIGLGVNAFRVDHVFFNDTRVRGIVVLPYPWGGELSGLIDHNTFEFPFNGSGHGVDIVASAAGGGNGDDVNGPFTRPFELGSNKSVVIEDNLFDFTFANDGCIDGFGGIQIVFRFNAIRNCMVGWHGADSAAYRGPHWFEVYGNTFTDTAGNAPGAGWFYRGGTGMQFGNTWTSAFGRFTNGAHSIFRARPEPFGLWAACDGTSPYDGNRGTANAPGHPCLDQLGWLSPARAGGAHRLTPTYFWLDRINGVQATFTNETSRMAAYMAENREWYVEKPGFNGTVGVGVGTLAARPTACTPGVGYWATDQGSWNALGPDGLFYTCTAPNTWALYYTPLEYPHPLSSATTPTPQPTPEEACNADGTGNGSDENQDGKVDDICLPPPPPDSDGDGVSDATDRCSGTPIGTTVDGFGCPLVPIPPVSQEYLCIITQQVKKLAGGKEQVTCTFPGDVPFVKGDVLIVSKP